MTRRLKTLKRSRLTFHSWTKNASTVHQQTSATARDNYLGSARNNEIPQARHNVFLRRVLTLRATIQAHTYNINDTLGEQRNPKSIFRRSDTVQFNP